MGRDRAIRYTVRMSLVSGFATPAEYRSKHYGRASDAGLANYVTSYNESILPGGVNAHIGPSGRCYAATLTDHNTGRTWEWKE